MGSTKLIAASALVAACATAALATSNPPAPPLPVSFPAADGVPVTGQWHPGSIETLVVVIAPRAPERDSSRARAVDAFRARGFSVLTFDYRDLDAKSGRLPDSLRFVSYASRWVDDMVGALRFAREHGGPRSRVFAWGEETGSAVALAASGRARDLCDAVVVEGLFRSIGEHLDRIGTGVHPGIVEQHKRLVQDRDQPAAAINRFLGPLFLVMAGRDSVTPVSITKELYRGRRARTEILSLPESGHGDAARAPRYFDIVGNWLKQWRFTPRPQ